MRNEFDAICAMCGSALGPGAGVVHARSRRRPFPVLCDSCMSEFDEMEREQREADRY